MEEGVRIRKRKRPRLKTRLRLIAAALLAAIVIAASAVNGAIRAPLISAAEEKARALALSALTDAALEAIAGGEHPIPPLEKSFEGGCIAITSDQAELNLAAAGITRAAQERIAKLGLASATVDLGSATGFIPLNGCGPDISMRFDPMGSVGSEIAASLRSAGINQSIFSVELILSAHLRVFIAGAERELEVKSTVPLSRMVLIGQVPQVYTNVANEDDMLNLIPTELP